MRSIRNPSWWLGVAVFGLAACTAPADQTSQADQVAAVDLAAEAAAVEAVSMQWLEAAQARDVDAATALFADDAVVFEEGQGSIVGVPAIRADIEEDWADNPDATVSWSTDDVQVASSGDMAWERGSWTYDPDGAGEAEPMDGEYVTVYKKVNGVWKVATDIGVSHEAEDEEMEGDDAQM